MNEKADSLPSQLPSPEKIDSVARSENARGERKENVERSAEGCEEGP